MLIAGVGSNAQSLSERETTRAIQRSLERLPYYGVFDFMAFQVDRGSVTLTGYAYHGSLRHAAEVVTKRTSGVDEVANRVELLPASQNDDRIRWVDVLSDLHRRVPLALRAWWTGSDLAERF